MQINRYAKQMNHGRPTRSKLLRTLPTLNYTLPLQQSLKDLVNHTQSSSKTPHAPTLADVDKIYDFLLQKLGSSDLNQFHQAPWSKSFFYSPNDQVPPIHNPVDLLNKAFRDVGAWVHTYASEVITVVANEELVESDDDVELDQ